MSAGPPSAGQVAWALRESSTAPEGVAVGSALRVSSWNEWDPLRHVIVGRADHGQIPASEPAVNAKVPDDSAMREQWGTRPAETIAMANAELDAFAALLEKRGIRVDRPEPIRFDQAVETPDFRAETQFGCMSPRDVLLTVGNEIVEATMSYRCRWFEYLAYRPLLERYFEQDRRFRHSAAPKPRLSDRSYRAEYFADSIDIKTRLRWTAARHFVTTEAEILFDAADVMRLGQDLIVQHGFTTNLRGIEWLRRHFPEHRVHTFNFPGDPYPSHIDCTLVPLRPGLMLANPHRPMPAAALDFLKRNGWLVVDAAPPAHDTPPPLCYSSVWLSMNVLMLDPGTVCVEESEVHQAEQLDRLGFEVVPVRLRDAYPFGGGLHCCTADVLREGECEDYLPKVG
jgi:glycine amidinotransferase